MARLPSTQTPPPRSGTPSPPPRGRKPRWSRAASVSVIRLGLLIGGLVIIADLATMIAVQRSSSAEDAASIVELDYILNYSMFSVLGVLVVRESKVIFAGVIAGVFASLLDAIVVTAATVMLPSQPSLLELGELAAQNAAVNVLFAAVSGIVFVLAQRWSGGRRAR